MDTRWLASASCALTLGIHFILNDRWDEVSGEILLAEPSSSMRADWLPLLGMNDFTARIVER